MLAQRVPPKASRPLISIDGANNIIIENSTITVSAGTPEHAYYFQQLRPGSTITKFEIPKWLDDFIIEYAIPQKNYQSNPLNQGRLAPKIVDPTTPGRSYELPSIWAGWLQENAIPGSGTILP
jgi:filamentous hemagglutinin